MILKNKTALITGGGSGIGFAIASALAKEGVHLILASRRFDLLQVKAKELSKTFHVKTLAVQLDLCQTESIQKSMAVIWKHFTTIDILVNNSGLGIDKPVTELTEADWDLVMTTNLKGAFLLTQAVLPKMIEQKSGHILNIASQAAKHGYARASVYCASKFGLVGFAQALQEEVREHHIKVSNLLPALVQVPPPKNSKEFRSDILQTEDLAAAALYLLSQPDRVRVEDLGLYHI
jgi:meso-butanediol dehydrogenase / (S,S)-butanediol dehydrogenase / diacetyl reductase